MLASLQTAVVVGVGSVGTGIVHELTNRGVLTFLIDVDPLAGDRTSSIVKHPQFIAGSAQCDATRTSELEAAVSSAMNALGTLDSLFITHGLIVDKPLIHCTTRDLHDIYTNNILGTFSTTNAFLPHIRASSGNKRIALTSSFAGLAVPAGGRPGHNFGLYSLAKHAVTAYGLELRTELDPEGIVVSLIVPVTSGQRLFATSARWRNHHPPTVPLAGDRDLSALGRQILAGLDKLDEPFIFCADSNDADVISSLSETYLSTLHQAMQSIDGSVDFWLSNRWFPNET